MHSKLDVGSQPRSDQPTRGEETPKTRLPQRSHLGENGQIRARVHSTPLWHVSVLFGGCSASCGTKLAALCCRRSCASVPHRCENPPWAAGSDTAENYATLDAPTCSLTGHDARGRRSDCGRTAITFTEPLGSAGAPFPSAQARHGEYKYKYKYSLPRTARVHVFVFVFVYLYHGKHGGGHIRHQLANGPLQIREKYGAPIGRTLGGFALVSGHPLGHPSDAQ